MNGVKILFIIHGCEEVDKKKENYMIWYLISVLPTHYSTRLFPIEILKSHLNNSTDFQPLDLNFFLNESPHNALTPRLGKKIARLAKIRILEKKVFEKNPIVCHIIVALKSNLHNSADFQPFDLKFWILKPLIRL